MYQLVAIGDITVDLYYQSESLTREKDRFSLAIGGKYYSEYFHHGLGGSAANIAIHASNLGLDTAVVAKVGENAFKNMIVQTLAKKTVSTEFLYFDRNHISISSILLSPSGERTIIKHSDPKEHIYLGEHATDRVMRSDMVFMGNLPDVPIVERKKLLSAVKSSENLIGINFGTKDAENGLSKLKTLISKADMLFLNRHEYAALIGTQSSKVNLKANQHKKLGLNIDVLVITDGPDGSFAYTDKDVYSYDAPKVKNVIDATGAGDSFTAAFMVKYGETKNIDQSIESATEYAAKVLTKVGAN